MKKLFLIIFTGMITLTLLADNVLGVHLGGVVQGAQSPNITLSSGDWDVDNVAVDQITTLKTTLTITDTDVNNTMPVALALGVHGDIGKYILTISANGKDQTVENMYGESALDGLGVFYGSQQGMTYPMTLSFEEENDHFYVNSQLAITAYYQS